MSCGRARFRRALCRTVLAGILVAGLASLGPPGSARADVDRPVRLGDATIVQPYDQSKALTHGKAGTSFSVRLPAGATCPGDSANDQWRIQSFMIPGSEDPTKLTYGPIGPDPTDNVRYALFGIDTIPFAQQYTQRNTVAGQPGIIPALPPLSMDVVAGEKIPSGTYRVGVACAYFGKTAQYWDTTIIITDQTVGSSEKLLWRLSTEPESVNREPATSGVPTLIAFAGVVAALLLAILVWRRHRTGTRATSRTTLSKEVR